ncbi:MAG: hypothetical protein PUK04_03180 [Bacteroidales bacterium]|nr:hypothetical protein [Bacteroidales bacterium]MDY6036122.1 hypothetical protein [Paludibacteraceae bacterium]
MMELGIEIGMFVVSVIGVSVACVHFNRQQRLEFFARYTERYQQIIVRLPECVYNDQPVADDVLQQILPIMRAYYDLCSEEYFLYQQKYLSKKVWHEWQAGMVDAFRRPVFRQCWDRIDQQGDCYHDFGLFIRQEMLAVDGLTFARS